MNPSPSENWYRNRVIALAQTSLYPLEGAPVLLGVEVEVAGRKRIDALFAHASRGDRGRQLTLTVVEVKRSVADANALVQLMGYMGRLLWSIQNDGAGAWTGYVQIEGVLAAPRIAPEVSEALVFHQSTGGGIDAWAVSDAGDLAEHTPDRSLAQLLNERDLARSAREVTSLIDLRFPHLLDVLRRSREGG